MKEKRSLKYCVLDVFTTESYKGNPLSVVFTDGNLKSEQYANIAKEFGYSETSFIYYSESQKALNVRSFTPTGVEVGGAGHNLLGAVAAAVLKEMDIFRNQESNLFVMMKESPITVFVDFDDAEQLPIVKMQQKNAIVGNIVPTEIIAVALGLATDDFDEKLFVPTIVQTEVAHLMIPILDLERLNSLRPNNKLLIEISKKHQFEGFYCFVYSNNENEPIAQARFFNPLIGIEEDAATGTAAGPLAGILAAKKLIQQDKNYQILQGVKLNQPSLIAATVTSHSILIGGTSVITMEGNLYL